MSLPARLTDPWFEAHFYCEANDAGGYRSEHEDYTPVSFAEAQGLLLWCPCGYGQLDANGEERFPLDLELNKGRPHLVMIPFYNPPSGILNPPNFGPWSRSRNTHPRWSVSGTSLESLSVQPSVAVGEPECWHGFITDGEVR